ncbi:hypothetical protein EDB19DRAFT_1912702 [Suillus lakei]|nr:hypothetical protein EDB19DRAFT_1912702 [Suillus lakei]
MDTGAETLQHTNQAMREQYIKEIKSVSSEEAGWHFGLSHTTTQQVEDFNIEEMGREMQSCAPTLWDLLGFLLGADSSCEAKDADADIIMDEVHDEYDSYWDDIDDTDLEGLINGFLSGTTPDGNKQTERHTAIVTISNTLQSILGIFLQSTHTPQKVINTLSCIGISISTDLINAAICSLSAESQNTLQSIGKSLLASYTYDNFDVDLKSQVPQAKKSHDIN